MKLVTLAVLKAAFGIEDSSEDTNLAAWEGRAADWIESQTGRRFQAATEMVEYKFGSGTRSLYLSGHVDVEEIGDAEISVRERLPGIEWSDLDSDAFEFRKGDMLLRIDGEPWYRNVEYEITYENGYQTVPGDLQDLVIELVTGVRSAFAASSSGGVEGITEEQIDDYTYKTGSSSSSSSSEFSQGSVSATGKATLNRWKRQLV